ncbi:hypothetical protein DENSPDRAFT_887131 [Dentipellis sp. KUC8613]|nr:hypothetical protein DENSPDRAFT_887131 [Dentipellis sp. KUC8613]
MPPSHIIRRHSCHPRPPPRRLSPCSALRRPLPPSRCPPPCAALRRPFCTLDAPFVHFVASNRPTRALRRLRPSYTPSPRHTRRQHATRAVFAASAASAASSHPAPPGSCSRHALHALLTPSLCPSRATCALRLPYTLSTCRTRSSRSAVRAPAPYTLPPAPYTHPLHHSRALCTIQPPSALFNHPSLPLRLPTASQYAALRAVCAVCLPFSRSAALFALPVPSTRHPPPPCALPRLRAPSATSTRHPPPPHALFTPSSPSPLPPHALLAVDTPHALPPSRAPARLIAVFARPLPSHLPTASSPRPSASPPPSLPSFVRCRPLAP